MAKMLLTGLAVAAFAMIALAVEAALDRRWPDRNETIFVAVVVGCLAVVGAAVAIHFGRFS